jgi:transcriptional regulator with XRE-family HTH domain
VIKVNLERNNMIVTGEDVKRIRMEKCLTAKDMAGIINLRNEDEYYEVESGDRILGAGELASMALGCNVNVVSIIMANRMGLLSGSSN